MTDDDRATQQEELAREACLKLRKPEGPAATGHCLNCGDDLDGGQRWCDADCRVDWEARTAR